MSYVIKKSDNTVLLELAEGFTDHVSSSLTFIGKNVSNFGELQNNNFLHLLENFASTSEPLHKLTGQLWFDKSSNVLKIYNSNQWQLIDVGLPRHALVSGGTAGNITVSAIKLGDRLDEVIENSTGTWVDLTNEFSITADSTINNGGGTNTTGKQLMVRWTKLTN
jgi:hypothetical protein